jgi:hypothetical protein
MIKRKTYKVPTTNFLIDIDKIDVQTLEKKFDFFAIEVPEYSTFGDSSQYYKLHNSYKNQLDCPYYFLSKGKPPTIYLLKFKDIDSTLNFTFNEHTYTAKKINFQDFLPPNKVHILTKVLLSSWFYEKHHTCQSDALYVHSKGKGTVVTALSLNIKAAPFVSKMFEINQSATQLVKVNKKYLNEEYINGSKYYERLEGESYYRQVKTEYVKIWKNNKSDKKDIWKLVTSFERQNMTLSKANIKWFEEYEKYNSCKSKLLTDFQGDLLEYYDEVLGENVVQQNSYNMLKIENKTSKGIGFDDDTGLFMKLLGEVGIYDIRFDENEHHNTIPIDQYVDFFNENYGKKYNIQFKEIKYSELSSTTNPVFVLQDYEKPAFAKDKILFGYDDEKLDLYEEFAHQIALQTMNVNNNKHYKCSIENYFDYKLITKKDFKHKIDVCLNELLLKYYVINNLPVNSLDRPWEGLPCVSTNQKLLNFAYMFRGVFMYFENNKMQFIDLKTVQGKTKRNEYLQSVGIDWYLIESDFAKRNRTRDEDGNDIITRRKGEDINQHTYNLKKTHFVFSTKTCLAIEDTKEYILHQYNPDKKGKSQRAKENITALVDVHYCPENDIYSVGTKGMGMQLDDGVTIRKLHYYQKKSDFDIEMFLKTMAVQFVRNKQFTVYPYFFDLINLYIEVNSY